MMTRLLCWACAALLFLAPTAEAADSESPVLSRIVKSGTLRVGMSGNQPPLNFIGKDGEWRGLEKDLAGALATLMEVELDIQRKPFGELMGALEKGEIDLIMSGMTITAERNLKVAFVGPYFVSGKSILTKANSPLARARETGELNTPDITLTALSGSTSQRFVEALLPNAKLITTEDYDKAVALLLGDQADGLIADYQIIALTSFRHQDQNLAASQQPLTIEPIGIAVPPGDSLLINFLENALQALETSGSLKALSSRWLEEKDWLIHLP